MIYRINRKFVHFGVLVLLLAFALILSTSPAFATHIWHPMSITCDPRAHTVTVTGYYEGGSAFTAGGLMYIDGVYQGDYTELIYAGAGYLDLIMYHPEIVFGSEVTVRDEENDTVSTVCREKGVPVVPYTGINLMSSADQAPYLSAPSSAGDLPCGVFDVNGWGAKYVGLGDFPGCTAPVTVMCFNADGYWTADTVSGEVMHGDWEVDFISHQDGTCGLFPSS